MDDKEIILKPLRDNVWGLKPTPEELIFRITNYNQKYSADDLLQIINDCYEEDLIAVDTMTNRLSITQDGLDFLQHRKSAAIKETTTPINTQHNLSAKSKLAQGFIKNSWNIFLGVIASLIATYIWYVWTKQN